MHTHFLDKDLYYTVMQLAQALGVSYKTVVDRVDKGEINPDYVHPVTQKRYFLKEAINEKYSPKTAVAA